jgi:hypothetical protein
MDKQEFLQAIKQAVYILVECETSLNLATFRITKKSARDLAYNMQDNELVKAELFSGHLFICPYKD